MENRSGVTSKAIPKSDRRLVVDSREIQEWCDFCEGKIDFPRDHFSGMFMDLYLSPLTDVDKGDLRTILRFFLDSSSLLEKMLRLDQPAPDKSDSEIISLVERDLKEYRQIVLSESLHSAIDLGV